MLSTGGYFVDNGEWKSDMQIKWAGRECLCFTTQPHTEQEERKTPVKEESCGGGEGQIFSTVPGLNNKMKNLSLHVWLFDLRKNTRLQSKKKCIWQGQRDVFVSIYISFSHLASIFQTAQSLFHTPQILPQDRRSGDRSRAGGVRKSSPGSARPVRRPCGTAVFCMCLRSHE